MCPRPAVGLQIAVDYNLEMLQVLGAEWTREEGGGQLVPDRDSCVRVGSTQVVSGTDWEFICKLVCVGSTSLVCAGLVK